MQKKNLFDKKLFIFDLDGVLYLGNEVIPGAAEVINRLKELNKKIYYLTNNSTKTRTNYVAKLAKMGITTSKNYIMTSAYATAFYLKQRRTKAKIFVIGETGLATELSDIGFKVLTDFKENEKVDYVVVGLDRNFNYKKLSGGLYYISKKAKFIATNTDPTLPTEKYSLPGAGSMVSALETCAGIKPSKVIGKPNAYTIYSIIDKERVGPQDTVMVGDRITTDILAGKNAGVVTIFVKTGAGEQERSKIRDLNIVPDFILNSIKDMLPLLKVKRPSKVKTIEKPSKFNIFLENLAKSTSFERMEMIPYLRQILKEQETELKKFKKEFFNIWENWSEEYGGSNIASFFVNKGKIIMLKWLSNVFPFRKEDFKIVFKEGGTTVDVVLDISYFFNEEELKYIKNLIKETKIIEISPQIALIRTLAETILAFSQVWDEVSGYNFTMMPEEDKTSKKEGEIIFDMVFTLRPAF
ncbi:MAG: HAD-IIA family hydrolase [Candidatus Helarchaeota archaeon]